MQSKIGPLLPMKWGQGAPYNHETPIVNGKRCPAGCVAVAVGQIMVERCYIYRNGPRYWPLIIGKKEIDWTTIFASVGDNKSASTGNDRYYISKDFTAKPLAIARLLRGIGNHIDMNYGPIKSGASSSRAAGFLSAMRFKGVQKLSYDAETVYNHINMIMAPVYISAYTYDDATQEYEGHAWVIDGTCTQQRTVTTRVLTTNKVVSTTTESRSLLHCNFGWTGICDGYYYATLFDLSNGPEDKEATYDDSNNNNNATSSSKYFYNHSIITYSGTLQ